MPNALPVSPVPAPGTPSPHNAYLIREAPVLMIANAPVGSAIITPPEATNLTFVRTVNGWFRFAITGPMSTTASHIVKTITHAGYPYWLAYSARRETPR